MRKYKVQFLKLALGAGKKVIKSREIDCRRGYKEASGKKVIRFNDMVITDIDLVEAIVSYGMPMFYLTPKKMITRRNEIVMKYYLINTGLVFRDDEYVLRNEAELKYLDATEKAMIDYVVGMIFTYIVAKKEYKQDFLVHLSLFRKYNTVEFYPFIPHNIPDLIGLNVNEDTYSVFEAKAYEKNTSKELNKALEQVQSISSICGKKPCYAVGQLNCYTKDEKMHCISIDPESEDGISITIDPVDMMALYYMPVAELFVEEKELNDARDIPDSVSILLGEVTFEIRYNRDQFGGFLLDVHNYVNEYLVNTNNRAGRATSSLYEELQKMKSRIEKGGSNIKEVYNIAVK